MNLLKKLGFGIDEQDDVNAQERAEQLGVKLHKGGRDGNSVDNDSLSDDEALRKANNLSVTDQNPFYRDNNSYGYNPEPEEKKPRYRGSGYLGRNKKKFKAEQNKQY